MLISQKPLSQGNFRMNNNMKMGELQRFNALTIHAALALAMMKMKLGLNTNI